MAVSIYKLAKKRNPEFIDAIVKEDFRVNESFHFIYDTCKKDIGFKVFLKEIAKHKAEIIEHKEYVRALYQIYLMKGQGINKIDTWKKESRNAYKQLKSIANHIFVKYEMPEFMYSAWLWEGNAFHVKYAQWFIDIGAGKNIRKSKDLPFDFTKKMAHIFMHAPDNLTPFEACWYSRALALTNDERTTLGFMGTKITRSLLRDNWFTMDFEFTDSLIRWFANNPMLAISQYDPIIDYIEHVKYETRWAYINGQRRLVPPEKANFSMKDRDATALLAAVEKWHLGTRKVGNKPKSWMPWEYEDYVIKTGNKENLTFYTFKQLTTAAELASEGRAHGHCVGSYANACNTGRCSIWSLRMDNKSTINKSLVTIELSKEREIVQVRGKGNRFPNQQEMSFIQKWASKEGFGISKWVKTT